MSAPAAGLGDMTGCCRPSLTEPARRGREAQVTIAVLRQEGGVRIGDLARDGRAEAEDEAILARHVHGRDDEKPVVLVKLVHGAPAKQGEIEVPPGRKQARI